MVRSTRILHKNEEFLVQDKNSFSHERTITFLARPDALNNDSIQQLKAVKTNLGEWVPVAKWSEGTLEVLEKESNRLVPTLKEVLGKYLEVGSRKTSTTKRKRYYYLEINGIPDYSISPSHPNGLAIKIFSSKLLAEKYLPQEELSENPTRIRQTNNLRELLIKAADGGFAGAVLDDSEPIYFCLDSAENMVFLKLCMDDEEEVSEYLLNKEGTWDPYQGEEDLEYYLDQDSCDRTMVEHLGDIPFFGHATIDAIWTLEERSQPGRPHVLSPASNPFNEIPGADIMVLFHDRTNALNFIKEQNLFECEAVRIENIKNYMKSINRASLSVILEPFNHRAVSGVLWLNK
ncbi:MAG: hypothetical protein ABIK28_15925, partial [Planctomycetota bacterium]